MRIEPAVLHHVAHPGDQPVAAARVDHHPVDRHRARVGRGQAQDEAEHGGLARPARAQEDVGGPRRHVEGDGVERHGGPEALGDVAEGDHPRILPASARKLDKRRFRGHNARHMKVVDFPNENLLLT